MSKQPKKSDIITTVAGLARACQRDRSTVSKWRSRPDWPVSRQGPWTGKDLQKIKTWMGTLADDPADEFPSASDSEQAVQAKLELIRQRTRKLELENGEAERRLIDRAEAEARTIKQIFAVRQAMQRAGSNIVHELRQINIEGPDGEIEKVVEAEMRAVCAYFSGDPDGNDPDDDE